MCVGARLEEENNLLLHLISCWVVVGKIRRMGRIWFSGSELFVWRHAFISYFVNI
jgi:hypothetical protein